jgi:hypothetical protein
VNFAILANPSAELELALADFEDLDLGFERRRQAGMRSLAAAPDGPANPAPALGEGRLDNLPVAARLVRGRLMASYPARRLCGQPQFVD